MIRLKKRIRTIISLNLLIAFPISLWLTYAQFKAPLVEILQQRFWHYRLFGLIANLLQGPVYRFSTCFLGISIALSIVWLLATLLFSKFKLLQTKGGHEFLQAAIRKLAFGILLILLGINLVLWLRPMLMKPKGPNVVLIGIDTLRADHLSCYGYKRLTTPTLDALAQEGVLFKQVMSHIPSTTASFASILTSKKPISHGVLRNNTEGFALDDWHVSLAEILKNEGYATAAFVSGWTMKKNGNLDQGFDVYGDQFAVGKVRSGDRRAGEVNQKVFDWLKQHHNEKFFLFVHYFDPHRNYDPPKSFKHVFDPQDGVTDLSVIQDPEKRKNPNFPLWLISQYDAEIRYCDHEIGTLMKKLAEYGIKDDTLIIVTSDHGETLIEHFRWWDHGRFVYDEQIHVPLIFWYPKLMQNNEFNCLVRLIDIFPTILNVLDIYFVKDIEGRSLVPVMKGNKAGVTEWIFSESARGDTRIFKDDIEGVKGKKFSIRKKNWKLIWVPKTTGVYYELYDLKKDPNELVNLWGQSPNVEANLKQLLDAYVANYKSSPYYVRGIETKRPEKFTKDAKLMEVFKALGYLQ